MEDRDTKLSIGVDVGVEDGMIELKGRRAVGVVGWEVHFRFKIASVVEGVGIDDDESHVPVEDVIMVELLGVSDDFCWGVEETSPTSTLTHFSRDRARNSFIKIRSAILRSFGTVTGLGSR